MAESKLTTQNQNKGWWLIGLVAIPTLVITVIGFLYAVKSQNVWKEHEPQWQEEGQAFGAQHTAQECVTETLKKEQNCEEIVCANLVRSYALACLAATPRDEALCRSVPIQPSKRRYSQWTQKVCAKQGYKDDLGCRTGLVGLMESCHPIPHNNYFPNVLDKSQREKPLFGLLRELFQ
jgi:hypothetical protein